MAWLRMGRTQSSKNRGRKRLIFGYPLLLFLLLCVGVYLVAWTIKGSTDSIFVSATVKAQAVTSPAVITSPADGTRFTSVPIVVKGTCPPNAAYVEIYRNNFMSGTAMCSPGGDFQLSTDLFSGQNVLVAHVFNVTDGEGPVSNPVTVYYNAPQQPSASQSTPSQTAVPPLTLKTAFVYKGYYVGQTVEWPLGISGGTAPYSISVDWGDGSTSSIIRQAEGDFKISHKYNKPGADHGSYTIRVNAADQSGQKAYIQFFVIVNTQPNSGLAGNIFSKPPPSLGSNKNWLWVAWPSYILVVLLTVSYWLGEREELLVLRKKGRLRRT